MKLNTIIKFLNEELKVSKIPDSSKNGLQVRGKNEVTKIAFGVDACMELFEKAQANKCDLVIVHHGLIWKPIKREELLKKRISYLKKNKISLYAVHLPLDAHAKYGNNIILSKMIGLKKIREFAKYHGTNIGYCGELDKPTTIKSLAVMINKKLKTRSNLLKFGKQKIKTVGVVSGKGIDSVSQAAKKKLDCLWTGENSHGTYHRIKELKINVITSGHYMTETVGVKALAELLKQKFKISTEFIYIPTRL